MSKVFVIDTTKKALNPVHPARARLLLTQGKAAVFRRYPFTIMLKREVEHPDVEPLRLKIDPGSKTTGLAIVNDATGDVVWTAELTHRGQAIKEALEARRGVRRSRRQRKTRYRKPRWGNRLRNKEGWLPPSLMSRVYNVLTWVARLCRYAPIMDLSQELVRFDTQLMENPDISEAEYQQGTLAGYELREYLLEKWGRQCAYCGAKDVPLQIEHILCCKKGGPNRESNLTIACEPCNLKKGTQDIRDFLKHKPDVLKRILAQAKAPLKDAAAVNATRWELYRRLRATGLPVECGTGGRTKFNRVKHDLDKTHWLDAACVGASTPDVLHAKGVRPLLMKAMGHGCRQMCRMDKYGFPRTGPKQTKIVKGFQTGDMVKAIVPKGKNRGTYHGRVAVRTSGSFNITTAHGTVEGIGYRYCQAIHRSDGYSYAKGAAAFPPVGL